MRVNPAGTDDQRLDLEALARTAYTTVMLPKCESADQVAALAPRDVVMLIESPAGCAAVAEPAAAANAVGVMWGAEDLFAVLGGTANRFADGSLPRRRQARPLAVAAGGQGLRQAGAGFGVPRHQGHLDGLRREVDDAVAVGFDAKVAIHPSQVAVIRAGYAPSPEQVDWARHVLAAAAEQPGAFAFEGIMVDAPVLRRAERIVQLAPDPGAG